MAFNPYGYNPYGMQMQMPPQMGYGQPVPDQLAQLRMQNAPQMAQQMPQQQMPPSVVFVDSEEEARAHRVMPNCEVLFIDLTAFKAYKKRAQSIGEPMIFKTFSITEDEESENQQTGAGHRRRQGQQAQAVEFATKAELNEAIGMINQLANIVRQMTAPKEATTNDETAV